MAISWLRTTTSSAREKQDLIYNTLKSLRGETVHLGMNLNRIQRIKVTH